jgi:hypothetical protein
MAMGRIPVSLRVGAMSALLGLVVPGAARPAAAQELKLTKPTAKLSHQFSVISGLRELSDGRVVVADGIDNVVIRADLVTQRMDTIGRAGSGPGEYKAPDALHPLPDDGLLLLDLGNARISMFDGSGKYRESAPIAQGSPGGRGPGGLSLIVPRATDGTGRIYYQPLGGGRGADSTPVIRWDRARARFDTVARVKLPTVIMKSSGTPTNQRQTQRPPPYPAQDLWTVAPDGRVALIRSSEYRVDWVAPTGERVVGKPIPAPPVPVREAEKREYLAEQAASGLSVAVENVNGNVSMRFSRGRQPDRDPEDEIDLSSQEWPATKPVATGWVATDPAGRAWVERSVAAGAPRSYDVLGPDGAVVRRVTLPPNRRLVSIGAKGLYARHVDGDGINYLERYSLP